MPTYLVERYLPGRDRAWLEAALARLPRERSGVAYLGSTYVPSDDSCFCRFEAETADDVRDANEVAGVPFARIVAAAEIGIGQPGPPTKEVDHEAQLVPAPGDRRRGSHRDCGLGSRHGPKPRKGALHVTKTCGDYHGEVGEFCTISPRTSSVIKRGMRSSISRPSLPDGSWTATSSSPPGTGACGRPRRAQRHDEADHVLGGTGEFAGFHADAVVSVDSKGLWHWDGTYSFSPHDFKKDRGA